MGVKLHYILYMSKFIYLCFASEMKFLQILSLNRLKYILFNNCICV